ncbi:MAG: hypothetical protein RQ731_07950 [Anaerosomatales bacterium]|nr:hypothetical protein [Anaerosomatales bacterium]
MPANLKKVTSGVHKKQEAGLRSEAILKKGEAARVVRGQKKLGVGKRKRSH